MQSVERAKASPDGVQAAKAACGALRSALGLGSVDAPDRWGEHRSAPMLGAPAVGIEIEVPWSFYFPELWERFDLARGFSKLSAPECLALGEACAEREAELLARLELTAKCGVPRGNDRYWEFAFDPCSDWRLPCAQVELIHAAGLLPLDGARSLQVTLGGIGQGQGAQALSRLLEAMCSSPERLMSGVRAAERGPIHSGWGRKGSGAVLEKAPSELKLSASVACEFRALSVPGDVHGLRGVLHAASRAGAALAAAQSGGSTPQVDAWMFFEESCGEAFAREGVGSLIWERGEPIPVASWERYAERFDQLRAACVSAWQASGLGIPNDAPSHQGKLRAAKF